MRHEPPRGNRATSAAELCATVHEAIVVRCYSDVANGNDALNPRSAARRSERETMQVAGNTSSTCENFGSVAPPDDSGSHCAARAVAKHLGSVRRFGRIAARSAAMHDVMATLDRVARTDVTVTLVGETGSGKDLISHALHAESLRAEGPLVVFDCGSVAANLVESELLGHERGSFTGAVTTHAGAFERAHGGTLFLDEVGELPLALQPRLLRALESRRVRRVGGKVDHLVDVRVIAATNRDLRAEVSAGRFREDLFFRLAVALVEVPRSASG